MALTEEALKVLPEEIATVYKKAQVGAIEIDDLAVLLVWAGDFVEAQKAENTKLKEEVERLESLTDKQEKIINSRTRKMNSYGSTIIDLQSQLDKANENNTGHTEIIKEMRVQLDSAEALLKLQMDCLQRKEKVDAELDTANKRVEEYNELIADYDRCLQGGGTVHELMEEESRILTALRALEVKNG